MRLTFPKKSETEVKSETEHDCGIVLRCRCEIHATFWSEMTSAEYIAMAIFYVTPFIELFEVSTNYKYQDDKYHDPKAAKMSSEH